MPSQNFRVSGVALSVTSGRLSYTFGLRGPAWTVDTACSSSLVGAHSAYSALLLGQCGWAANSGCNVTLYVDTPAMLVKATMLSGDGRCKALDSRADGYSKGDACGTMIMRALEPEELADPDSSAASDVLAVVLGTAVNQDGRSSALTAPNGPAQQEVLRQALGAAGLAPHQIGKLRISSPMKDFFRHLFDFHCCTFLTIETRASPLAFLPPPFFQTPWPCTAPAPAWETPLKSVLCRRCWSMLPDSRPSKPAAGGAPLTLAAHSRCCLWPPSRGSDTRSLVLASQVRMTRQT